MNTADKLNKKKYNKFTYAKKDEKETKNQNTNFNYTRSRFNNKSNKAKRVDNKNYIKSFNIDSNSEKNQAENLIDLNQTKEDSNKNTSRSDSIENLKHDTSNHNKQSLMDNRDIIKIEKSKYFTDQKNKPSSRKSNFFKLNKKFNLQKFFAD